MGTIKKYDIPFFEFRQFSIAHFENSDIGEEIDRVYPGYYGIHGSLTITNRCETAEEAEKALEKAVVNLAVKELDKLSERTNTLTKGLLDFSAKGISSYLLK
jgi:hypothetical protein